MSSPKQGALFLIPRGNEKALKVDKKDFDESMKVVYQTLEKVAKFMELTAEVHSKQSREAAGGRVDQFMKFWKLNPPSFNGSSDSLKPYDWISDLKKIFKVLDISEEYWVSFAVFMLKGDAGHWWRMAKPNENEQLKWDEFKEIFYQQYFPERARRQKVSEFIHLTQGNLTVSEYSDDFNDLARFAKHIIPNDYETARKFEEGLRLNIRSQVSPLMLETYEDVLRAARTVESEAEECQRDRRKRGRAEGNDRACFSCGRVDHLVRDCPYQNGRRESVSLDSEGDH